MDEKRINLFSKASAFLFQAWYEEHGVEVIGARPVLMDDPGEESQPEDVAS